MQLYQQPIIVMQNADRRTDATELQQYQQQVVAPLAQDKEVDCDLVEHFLRSLGYDETKLRSDVEAYRIDAARRMSE